MTSSIGADGIRRRAILATAMAIPVIAGLFHPSPSLAQAETDPLPFVEALRAAPERGWVVVDMAQDWNRVFATCGTVVKSRIYAAAAADRDLRSRRYTVGRAPEVRAGSLLPRPRARSCEGKAGAGDR